ncbi:MAG: hypothetical protein M3Y05_03970 [Gemmatimonadota bacterium]|nr:hypothetical protein [Gemmatimonadota bacterium]
MGRDVALVLFAIVGVSLLSSRAAEWVARPAARAERDAAAGIEANKSATASDTNKP